MTKTGELASLLSAHELPTYPNIYSTEFGDKAKIIQPTSGLQYKSIQLFLG